MEINQNLIENKNISEKEYNEIMKPSNSEERIDKVITKEKVEKLPNYFYDYSYIENFFGKEQI